ncbi:DNA-directed RNA polymerase specialized sigma subunit, sigma24 homolog [Streptomyces sp. Amel2xC10]|nr:DNA-directed RNA polymerase specialized sigma subunit, sigma24 homolog [Streptomyces sp. Amel2xC10]
MLTLCLWEGLEYAEAARVLGIPVGTVRSRLSRARGRLRKLADAQPCPDKGKHANSPSNKRELTTPNRKITGDHGYVIRSAQEGNR